VVGGEGVGGSGRGCGSCKSETTVGGDARLAVGVAVGRVASVGGAGCSRSHKRESSLSLNARSTVRVAVCRVAGVSSAGRRWGDERECAVGRDTLDSLRIGVGRVAGVLRGSGLTLQRTGESTGSGRGQREEKCALHVGKRLMGGVEEDVGVLSEVEVRSVCCCWMRKVNGK
jgi:hypothetical protein